MNCIEYIGNSKCIYMYLVAMKLLYNNLSNFQQSRLSIIYFEDGHYFHFHFFPLKTPQQNIRSNNLVICLFNSTKKQFCRHFLLAMFLFISFLAVVLYNLNMILLIARQQLFGLVSIFVEDITAIYISDYIVFY